MTTDVKGKTKATGAKGKTKATDLKEFLSNLATDPRKLGEFLHAPEPVMSAANLSEADKTALRSGVSGMVAARLAGVPLDQDTPQIWKPPTSRAAPNRTAVPSRRKPSPTAPPNRTDSRAPTNGLTPQPASLPQFVVYQPQLFVVQPPYYPR